MRILVTGASGGLGAYVLPALLDAGHEPIGWGGATGGERSGVPLRPIDLTDHTSVGIGLDDADPAAIVHLAAISTAAAVLRDPERARRVNVEATAQIAEWCKRRCRRMIYASTDLAFDGYSGWRRETDLAEPVVYYGLTKLAGEAAVVAVPEGLVTRLPLLFGPSRCGRPGFFDDALAALERGEPRAFFEDEYRTPLDYATAARAIVLLIDADVGDILHVAGAERMSRFDLMRRVAVALGIDERLVHPNRRADAVGAEPRPEDVSLDTGRLARACPGLARPSVEEAAREWRV